MFLGRVQPLEVCCRMELMHNFQGHGSTRPARCSGVLVGPEQGSWQLEEASITNSREHLTQQFICRDVLGRGDSPGAAYMTPVPPGTVVYGSGDQAVLLTRVCANMIKPIIDRKSVV